MMVFELDTTQIGCGAKIRYRDLRRVQKIMNYTTFRDAERIDVSGEALFTSIDTVGRFCTCLPTFVQCTVQHCFNDLYTIDAAPLSASAMICYGPEFVDDHNGMGYLVTCLINTLEEHGAVLGKLHSTMGPYSTLTLASLGVGRGAPAHFPLKGRVYLSRPIGAFKRGVFYEGSEIGAQSFSTMTSQILKRRPPNVTIMTDVAGFGLGGSLLGLAEQFNLFCSCSVSPQAIVHQDVYSIPSNCLVEDLSTEEHLSVSCERAFQVACCRELAGPMVMLVEETVAAPPQLSENLAFGNSPIFLGTYARSDKAHVEVMWRD